MTARKALLAGALLVLIAGGAAALFALVRLEQSEDVLGSSTVEFVPTEVPEPAAPPIPGVAWPTYGFNQERLRTVGFRHRPPFRRVWTFRAGALVEFPPVIAYNRLYFANNFGVFFAVNADTGKRAWKFRSGRCVASSPAVSNHVVFQTFLNAPPCNRGGDSVRGLSGELIAFSAGFGKIRWRARIGPSESSPLVNDGMVYVGDWTGRVYAFDERTGRVRWTFRTGDRVKGAATLSGNRLYVGSYDHRVYALNARTGKLIWRAAAQQRLGSRGTFYSTPAAAYGRVYIGSTDQKVYSFGAASGKLRWSQGTGGFVYSSPAIYRRLVLIGSYSGRFYALDAATGETRWTFHAEGPISGSPTVVDGVVYFATLEERTYALDARTGRRLWSYPDGKYTPVVADDERLYLVGEARIYGMEPSSS
jgi:outer membrane protein assembly factor BamB